MWLIPRARTSKRYCNSRQILGLRTNRLQLCSRNLRLPWTHVLLLTTKWFHRWESLSNRSTLHWITNVNLQETRRVSWNLRFCHRVQIILLSIRKTEGKRTRLTRPFIMLVLNLESFLSTMMITLISHLGSLVPISWNLWHQQIQSLTQSLSIRLSSTWMTRQSRLLLKKIVG